MKNKVADQTARTRRLVCAFVVATLRRQVISRRGPFYSTYISVDIAYYEIFCAKVGKAGINHLNLSKVQDILQNNAAIEI